MVLPLILLDIDDPRAASSAERQVQALGFSWLRVGSGGRLGHHVAKSQSSVAAAVLDTCDGPCATVEAVRSLRGAFGAHLPVVVLLDEGGESALRPLIRAGVESLIDPRRVAQDVGRAVTHALRGEAFMSPRVLAEVCDLLRRTSEPRHRRRLSPAQDLTAQEGCVVDRLLLGMSNGAIAEELDVTEATVKSHLSQVMKKWRVSSRLQVVLHAMRAEMDVSPVVETRIFPEDSPAATKV